MGGTRSESGEWKRTGSRGGTFANVGERGRREGRRGENVAIDLVVHNQFLTALVVILSRVPVTRCSPPSWPESRIVFFEERRAPSTA